MDGGPDGPRRNGPCIERGAIGQTARMARAIWSGTLTFGLVTIPVKLYPAVQRKAVRFNQLDGEDNSRIQQRRVNSATGEEVPYDRLVKGYEISPDRYVVVTQEELDSLDPGAHPHDRDRGLRRRGRDRPDPLRRDVLRGARRRRRQALPPARSIRCARAAASGSPASCCARRSTSSRCARPTAPCSSRPCCSPTRSSTRPASRSSRPSPRREASERELGIAEQLIGSLAAAFDPEKYTDEYRARVLDLIERKAQGEQIEIVAAPAEAESPVPDLMSALKASLDAVREREPRAAPPKKPAAKKRAAKKPAAKKPAAKRATACCASPRADTGALALRFRVPPPGAPAATAPPKAGTSR